MDIEQGSSETITWKSKLKSKLSEYGRVLRITKKPSKEEFKTIVKVSGLGIMAIGLLGFLVHIIREVLFK